MLIPPEEVRTTVYSYVVITYEDGSREFVELWVTDGIVAVSSPMPD